MPLFNTGTANRIPIDVYFTESNDEIKIVDPKQVKEGDTSVKKETFYFKTPNWGEVRHIMSASSIAKIDGITLDPFRFIDMRIKMLLVDWTLKEDKGEKLKLTEENIERLPPSVVSHINVRLDQLSVIANAFGSTTG